MIPADHRARSRAAGAAVVAAACALGALVSLAAGAGPVRPVVLAAAGVGVLGSVLVPDRVRPTDLLVGVGVAASCGDAIRVGAASLFDVLCAVGVLAAGAAALLRRDEPVRRPARVCLLVAAGFTAATVLVAVFPPDSFHMASRFRLAESSVSGSLDPAVAAGSGLTDLTGLVRLLVGVLAVPFVLGWYATTRARLEWVGRAFLAGAAASCVVALTDYLQVTAVGELLLGYTNADGRVNGLTTQPNHLALTAAMALPFAWFTVRRWPWRLALTGLLLAGVGVSGSRAGLIGATAALLVCAAWQHRARFVLFAVPGAVAAALALSELLSFTRFGTQGAEDSDVERARLIAQGWSDFLESPLYGVGLQVAQDAHVVYLQLLAGAGLIGLLSFGVLYGTAFVLAHRLRRRPVVLAAGIALVTYLVVAAASNALLVRYVFVPLAIVTVASCMEKSGCIRGKTVSATRIHRSDEYGHALPNSFASHHVGRPPEKVRHRL